MMRKKPLVQALAALALLATTAVPAAEDQRPAGGYGPGHGMQPGMMGMMNDCPGGGGMMGPGMGMMGGPGMMMGPGMMGGHDPGSMLNLDESQQKKITQIQDELRKKHWGLMGKMNDEYAKPPCVSLVVASVKETEVRGNDEKAFTVL